MDEMTRHTIILDNPITAEDLLGFAKTFVAAPKFKDCGFAMDTQQIGETEFQIINVANPEVPKFIVNLTRPTFVSVVVPPPHKEMQTWIAHSFLNDFSIRFNGTVSIHNKPEPVRGLYNFCPTYHHWCASQCNFKHLSGRPLFGKILVLSKSLAEKFTCSSPWACISVSDDGVHKINSVQRVHLLQLLFHDIEFARGDDILFNEKHAVKIKQFVDVVWSDIQVLMIHCYAGVSRSAAIGMAIADTYHPEYARRFYDYYTPNQHVYRTLAKILLPKGK